VAESLTQSCARVFEDSRRASADLLRIAGGSGERAGALLTLLGAVPDPDAALTCLARFTRTSPLPAGDEERRALLQVFGHSLYLTELILEDPSIFEQAMESRRRSIPTPEELEGRLGELCGGRPREERWRALRRFKEQCLLSIALRDFLSEWPLAEVTEQLSLLADTLLGAAVRFVLEEVESRYGKPTGYDEEEGQRQDASAALLALGKLGGRELNYSSDVDLLFLYSHDGETQGIEGQPRTVITNKEFFTLVAQGLTRRLASAPGGGWILRVDWGLRPGGKDGDLTLPLEAALAYYRSWARPWERQALIKARSVAGDPALSQRFIHAVQGLAYPENPGGAATDSIRVMKDRIDASLAARGTAASDLKLGRGGIREIEFSVQGRQILHAGRDAWLRESNSMRALHKLAEKRHLSRTEFGALAAAYEFLREAEHRIQIRRNLQRSTLPSAPREMRVLARTMGHTDPNPSRVPEGFLVELDRHRATVRSHYDAFLASQSQERLEEVPSPNPFLDPLDESEAIRSLAAEGWPDPPALLGTVRRIARHLAPPAAPAAVRRLFRLATPVILREGAALARPAHALRNLERLIESLAVDSPALGRFLERPERLAAILRLLEGSQPLSNLLIHRPQLLAEPAFERALAADRNLRTHMEAISKRLEGKSSFVERLAGLRLYRQGETLLIGIKDLSNQLTLRAAIRALSELGEACVRGALRSAREALVGEGEDRVPGFCVLALGRLGYREMDYGSDMDLVFLYRAPDDAAGAHASANDLAGRVVEALATITREGSLYAVDTRLRPFGSEGELAQPSEALLRYLGQRAGVWEMQSYLKARAVAGDLRLGERLLRRAERVILDRARREDLAGAIREMRDRLREAGAPPSEDLRSGDGGINTVGFTLQYLQLRHHVPSPPRKSTTRLLMALRDLDLVDADSHAALYKGHRFLRRFEHQLRLIHGRAITRVPRSGDLLAEVARGMGYTGESQTALLADLGRRRAEIEEAFDRIVPRSG
jgi:glutamate-ammonia-ligase adenylyltransferase